MGERTWHIASPCPQHLFEKHQELHPVAVQMLFNRGITRDEDIQSFFQPVYERDIHDPFLFRDMDRVVSRLFHAAGQGELIVVYGDYDVDGVCGAAIMQSTLERIGAERIHTHLPHREKEGYGLNHAAVEEFREMGATVLITVDCGVANVEEVATARAYGIDVIIVDHHQAKAILPEAYAIIHSGLASETYPFKFLSGGGTAFKVAQALLRRHAGNHDAFEKWMLDLVALSTIADMVPLVGENRALAVFGLKVLNKTSRIGLRCLMQVAGLSLGRITVDDVSWRIAPRLNAAGRMDHANAALAMVRATDQDVAQDLAEGINAQNNDRQRLTERMVTEIKEQIGAPQADAAVVHAINDSWPVSLLGLAAGRIVDHYGKPAFIMARMADKIMGSGRSVPGADLVDVLNNVHAEVPLERFGGHAQACGFTVRLESYSAFVAALERVASQTFDGKDFTRRLEIDAVLGHADVDWPWYGLLQSFAPHGVGNPQPLFMVSQLSVVECALVGNGEKHLKMRLRGSQGRIFPAIGFGLSKDWSGRIAAGSKIDVVCVLEENVWNGNRELQLHVKDLRFAV